MNPTQMATVRVGLRQLVQDTASWPAPNLKILQNLLLDACGGDARPLITLIIRAAEFGIPDRLPPSGTDPVEWERRRGALVVTLVAEAFVQQEWATWAVESWAFALGVITTDQLRIGVPAPAAPRAAPGSERAVPPRAVVRPQGGASRRAQMAPPRVASVTTASTPRLAPLPTIPFGLHTRRGQLLGAALVLVLIIPVVYVGAALRARRSSGIALTETPVPVAPGVPAPAPGVRPGIPSLTLGGLPAPRSGEEVIRVVPPTRAGQPSDPSRYPPAYTTYTAAPLDRIRLRGGRELTGRVEVVRASTVQFRDGESGLRYEFRKSEIAEITTEFGTKVRFTPDGQPTNATRAAAFTASALQGHYIVRYGKGSVVGSAACSGLWAAPLADDEADVNHLAGADTLTITFRGGGKFTAVVDDAGLFASSVVIVPDQARSSQALITRIEGKFLARGFEATVHILGYRRALDGKDIGCQSRLPATGQLATEKEPAPSPVQAIGP